MLIVHRTLPYPYPTLTVPYHFLPVRVTLQTEYEKCDKLYTKNLRYFKNSNLIP